MKTILRTSPFSFKKVLLFTCLILIGIPNISNAAETPIHSNGSTRVAVNFVQNEERNELSVSLKSGSEASMQLFLFSPDGILIEQVSISTRRTTTIKGLKRGYYLYECFNNDQRMKRGSLLIK